MDMSSANYEGNSATVLIDNGFGRFYRADYPIPGFPRSVYAADLDGDGDRDLALSVNGGIDNPTVVSVFKNDGNGSFPDRADYPVVKFPNSIKATDFDGDGDLDLAVVNEDYTANSVSVLKNNGDGTFAPKTDWMTGGVPRTLAVADLDGDGDIDVVTANGDYPHTISVLKNNGDGSFSPKVDYPGGYYTIATTALASDLDKDGDIDLAISNWNYTAFSVFKNNGDGIFAPRVDYGSGDFHGSIFGADLDGDGDTDIGFYSGRGGRRTLLAAQPFENAQAPAAFAERPDTLGDDRSPGRTSSARGPSAARRAACPEQDRPSGRSCGWGARAR